jgi:hypothetical protein
MTLSPLEPLSSILAAPITKEDLTELEGCAYDEDFIKSFEEAWSSFLGESFVPTGAREDRIVALQDKAKEIVASTENVELELKKQSAFLRSSREELEKVYSTKMQDAMDKQRAVHDDLSKKLDSISLADQLQQECLPWLHFMKELDSLVVKSDSQSTNSSDKAALAARAKPSARSMILAELSETRLSADAPLRAYRIDHALLQMHVTMLKKEIVRYEKLIESQEDVANFLTKHDVWKVLKTSDTPSVAGTEISGLTLPMSRC